MSVGTLLTGTFFVVTGALCSFNAQARVPWQDHTVFGINKLAPHATAFPYQSQAAALIDNKQNSTNFLLLNGDWQFDWQRSPKTKPVGFEQPNFDDTAWGRV